MCWAMATAGSHLDGTVVPLEPGLVEHVEAPALPLQLLGRQVLLVRADLRK